jgi:acyl-CoA thioesterase-1
MKTWTSKILLTTFYLALSFLLTTFIDAPLFDHPSKIVDVVTSNEINYHPQTSTILIIGSSVAAGWGDNHQGGYLIRALTQYATKFHQSYHILNWSIPGLTTKELAPHFKAMLQKSHPDIVILSWGGLDDAAAGTTASHFLTRVKLEVNQALQAKAYVLIITPPVTQATYKNSFKGLPRRYFQAQMHAFSTPDTMNVSAIDLFSQMLSYINKHHISESTLAADGWHPNSKGHALAGNLLFTDLSQLFHHGPIKFHSP